MCIIA